MQIPEEHKQQPFENILPLVNVVFLLLIFFMLAGAFSKPDFYKIDVPYANNNEVADRKELTVVMNAAGELAVDDRPYTDAELKKHLLAQGERADSGSILKIQLKADARAESKRLLAIMGLLAEANIDSVRLITQTQ